MSVVRIAGKPFEARALARWPDPWRPIYMDLLKRARHLALSEDLLQSQCEWSDDPRRWSFNLAGLNDKERRVLGRFREAAIRLFLDHDRDLDEQINRHFRELAEELAAGLSFRDGFDKVARFRDLFVTLADRRQASEPRWRRMAAEFQELLEDAFFTILAGYRRFAVKQLLRGRWTATEGRAFLGWVDLEHHKGYCTLREFGEFVVALDQAEVRPAS
jgi:hypothetical protein